jgi:hypothetical protein
VLIGYSPEKVPLAWAEEDCSESRPFRAKGFLQVKNSRVLVGALAAAQLAARDAQVAQVEELRRLDKDSSTSSRPRRRIEALAGGERDPRRLADLAVGAARRKRDQIARALTDSLSDDRHALPTRMHLDHIDFLDRKVSELESPATPGSPATAPP